MTRKTTASQDMYTLFGKIKNTRKKSVKSTYIRRGINIVNGRTTRIVAMLMDAYPEHDNMTTGVRQTSAIDVSAPNARMNHFIQNYFE